MSFTTTIPLTTIFTPPSDCISRWTFEPESWNSVPGGVLLKNAAYNNQDTSCYPASFNNWGRAPSFIQVFSPGACPSGYNTVSNGYNDGSTTTAVCCPKSFSYTATLSSVNAGNKSAEYYGCTSLYSGGPTPTTVYAQGSDGYTSNLYGTTTQLTTISTEILMWAQPITVAFHQKDLALFTTSASAATSSTPGPSTQATPSNSLASSTSTSPPTSSPTSSSSSGSTVISSGAIAGIAIGAAAVLGILIGLAIFFRRRKNGKPQTPNEKQIGQPGPNNGTWQQPNEYAGYQYGHVDPPKIAQELAYEPRQQRQAFAELGTNADQRYELPSERR